MCQIIVQFVIMSKLNKLLFTILFFPISQIVVGQNIYLSDVFNLKINDNIDIIGQLNGYNFFIQTSSGEYKIHRLDQELKNIRTHDLPFTERRSEILYTGFVNKNLNIVYKYRSRSDVCFKLMVYDTDLNLKDSATLACFSNLIYNPQIDMVISEDKNSFLLYYHYMNEHIQFFSFDLITKKLIWSYKWDHNLEKTEFRFLEKILFDNNKNAFLIFNDQSYPKSKSRIFCAYLSSDGVVRKTFQEFPFTIYEADWVIDNKNQRLILSGTYSNDKGKRANGSLYSNIELSLASDTLFYALQAFKAEYLTGIIGEKEKPEKGLEDIYVPNIILKQDGGTVIILERNKKIERFISGRSANFGGFGRNIVDYFFDDLLVVSINKIGKVEWVAPLAKKQFSQDDEGDFSSFLLFKSSNVLRLIFNDEIKNENTISQYIVTSDGSFERRSILNTNYRKLKIMFRHGKQTSGNTCIIPCYSRNKLKFLKIEF